MNLTIENIRLASIQEWDSIWENCDFATYFQSREWSDMWCEYTKGRTYPNPMLLTFSDGKKVLLPFSAQKILKGIFRRYVTSPAGTFGGWISSDKLDVNHARKIISFMTKILGNIIWRINPYDPSVSQLIFDSQKDGETYFLNLKNGFQSIEKKWSNGKGSLIRKVRKAQRRKVIIEMAKSRDQWRKYFELYESSLMRWGMTVASGYAWRLFEIIYNFRSKNVILWLANYEDKPIAGALCFYARKHAVYWHGAADSQFFTLRPVNLLMYEIIKNACEQDYDYFDFNPSGENEGTKLFKKSFSAETADCPLIRLEKGFAGLLARTKKTILKY